MTFKTYHTSKSAKLIRNIIKIEALEVKIRHFTDAIGDSIIEVSGDKEDIATLKEIYKMIA